MTDCFPCDGSYKTTEDLIKSSLLGNNCQANIGVAFRAWVQANTPSNHAPVINNQSFSIAENSAHGTSVGTVAATDPDNNTLTFSIISGNTSGAFSINSATGVLSVANTSVLNHEVIPSFSLVVRVTDNGTPQLNSQATIAITVTNVNETPTDISLSAQTITENNAINAVIGAFTTTDPDAGNTFTYTLVSGTGSTDNGSFNISSANLRAGISFDYETKSSYSIRVRSIDQEGLYFEKVFTIVILDASDIPQYSSAVFWLNGTISGSNAVDAINGWLFPISAAPDWDTSLKIFPFRTPLTISPPANGTAAATAIQAADPNHFWYAANGTPNVIPFVCFHPNIDFADKSFARQVAQTVDGTTGIEITPAGINCIALYSTAQTAHIAEMVTFYGSDVQPVAGAYFVAPGGNDSTGVGSWANPWATNDHALHNVVTGKTVYCLGGTYDEYNSSSFKYWIASETGTRTFITTGKVVIKATQSTTRILYHSDGSLNLYGYIFDGEATRTIGVGMSTTNAKTLNMYRCKVYNCATSSFQSGTNSATDTVNIYDSVFPDTAYLFFGQIGRVYRSYANSRASMTDGDWHYNKTVQASAPGFNQITNATSIKWSTLNVYTTAINKATASAIDIQYNTFNLLYTSNIGSNVFIVYINHDSCVPTIRHNTFNSPTATVAGYYEFISLPKCITPVFSDNKVFIDSTANITILNLVISAAGQGKVTCNNNILKSNVVGNPQIQIGGETDVTDKLNETEFVGNHVIGSTYFRPATSPSTTHFCLLSGGKDFKIERNLFQNTAYAMVLKSGNVSQTYTKNGINHNIFKDNRVDIWIRGVNAVPINNNSHSYASGLATPADQKIKIDENSATAGTQNCANIIIKNAIMYNLDSAMGSALIYMDAYAGAHGCVIENCIVHNAHASNKLMLVGATDYTTMAAIQSASLDTGNASLDTDPLFVSATDLRLQSASPCKGAGLTIGGTGLDVTSDYSSMTDPPTVVTATQNNDCGAYVY